MYPSQQGPRLAPSPGHPQSLPSVPGLALLGPHPTRAVWGQCSWEGGQPCALSWGQKPRGGWRLALLGAVPALSRGHRPGLAPQLCKGGKAAPRGRPVLFWDVLPVPHRCQCPWADTAGRGHGCGVPAVGSPASSSWHARVLGAAPFPLPGPWRPETSYPAGTAWRRAGVSA